ncbi:MAG: hypothetical protein IH987_15250 [Planctomycetes bacterium]|nr:hypothetical protein [Planctomycetota bacterium]
MLCLCLTTACPFRIAQPPPELEEPGVRKGDGLFDKKFLIDWREVFPDCGESTFPRRFGEADTDGEADLIQFLTECGTFQLDVATQAVVSRVEFDSPCERGWLIDVDTDGTLESFCYQDIVYSGDPYEIELLDPSGNTVWTKSDAISFSGSFDLDGNGTLDMCGEFADATVKCFDLATGNTLWEIDPLPDDFWSVRMVETEEGTFVATSIWPDKSVLSFNWEYRDHQGNLVGPVPEFCTDTLRELCLLDRRIFEEGTVQLVSEWPLLLADENGDVLLRTDFPDVNAHRVEVVDAVLFRGGDGDNRTGVVWSLIGRLRLGSGRWRRYLFIVYDPNGEPVYEELFVDYTQLLPLNKDDTSGAAQPVFVQTGATSYLYQLVEEATADTAVDAQ